MAMLARLAIVVFASAGCGGAFECLDRGQGGAYEECVASKKPPSRAEKREAARQEAERRDQEIRDGERHQREYEAAKRACAARDPKACATVAFQGSLRGRPKAEIVAALEIACDGKIADSCFELGNLMNDVGRLASACELGNRRACEVAARRDPAHAMELDSRACELHDGVACERVAAVHEQRRDRAQTEKYLRLACREDRKDACQKVGEMAVGDR